MQNLIIILYLILLPLLSVMQAYSEAQYDNGNKLLAGIVRDLYLTPLFISVCMLFCSKTEIFTPWGSVELLIYYLLCRWAFYDWVYNKTNHYIGSIWYVGQTKWTDRLIRKIFPVENHRGWFLFITKMFAIFVAAGIVLRLLMGV